MCTALTVFHDISYSRQQVAEEVICSSYCSKKTSRQSAPSTSLNLGQRCVNISVKRYQELLGPVPPVGLCLRCTILKEASTVTYRRQEKDRHCWEWRRWCLTGLWMDSVEFWQLTSHFLLHVTTGDRTDRQSLSELLQQENQGFSW